MSDARNDHDEDQEDGGGNNPPSHTYLQSSSALSFTAGAFELFS
jgi:hypothetical protein